MISEVLVLARSELRRHDVVLRTELAAKDRPVAGDPVQLQQVLLNLIMNGVEAMGGVTERARELTVSSTLAEPGSVLVAVEDTGSGLDPAVADFNPLANFNLTCTEAQRRAFRVMVCRAGFAKGSSLHCHLNLRIGVQGVLKLKRYFEVVTGGSIKIDRDRLATFMRLLAHRIQQYDFLR